MQVEAKIVISKTNTVQRFPNGILCDTFWKFSCQKSIKMPFFQKIDLNRLFINKNVLKVDFDETSQIINIFLNVILHSVVPFKTSPCKWNKNNQRRQNMRTKTGPGEKPRTIVLYFEWTILKYNAVIRGGSYKIPFLFKSQISKIRSDLNTTFPGHIPISNAVWLIWNILVHIHFTL